MTERTRTAKQGPGCFFVAMAVLALAIAPTDVFGACEYEPDAPDCPCFDDTGAWDPPDVLDYIQDVAIATVGTRESCVDDGGKPYYQMVLGCNSELGAFLASWVLALPDWLVGDILDGREAWCSETIAYWHRETGIPYNEGYRTDWHLDWQVHNVGSLKSWYVTEENLADGRGRWIEPGDVDYEDFELGVTVPVPGAYVAIRAYDAARDRWIDDGNTHSLMINEMWVHEDILGKVVQVEVTLLEGNSSNRVKDTRHWDDILSLTPQGSEWIGTDRKIYGFGIDLNSRGQPVYDGSRLHYVHWPYIIMMPYGTAVETEDKEWAVYYTQYVPPLRAYAKMLRMAGGPKVTCSSSMWKPGGVPDGDTVQWRLPKGLPGGTAVEIDLRDVHPLPIKGIQLRWDSDFVPWNCKVQFADAAGKYHDAILPSPGTSKPPKGSPSVAVPAVFATSATGTEVRFVKLIFPTTLPQEAILQELRFRYWQGPLKDSEQGPVEPDCFPSCRKDYGQWVAVGKPECWCYPRQCHGDADGRSQGSSKTGLYYAGTNDLNILIAAWQVKEPPNGLGIKSVPNGICADFAREQQGSAKTGFTRVGTNDLNVLVANWLVKEPPKGPGIEPDCFECQPR